MNFVARATERAGKSILADGEKPGRVVLVVEDEAIIRMLLVDHLEKAEYKVLEARRADVAVEMLKTGEAVDAVVTDLRMPGQMDGLGLMRWLRENRGATPVIVTTGYVTEEDAVRANPTATVVLKPYDPRDICTLLNALVR